MGEKLPAEGLISEGYKYYCINCFTAYKHLPQAERAEGGFMDMCKCDSDLFAYLKDDSMVK